MNLLAEPKAWVRVRRPRPPVTAEVLEGEERARLWAVAARAYPRDDEMAEEARPREIPLVRLCPRTATAASSPNRDG